MDVNFSHAGAYVHADCACQHTAAVAAGTGDNAYIVGQTFDLLALPFRPTSAILIATWETTLASSETLSLKSKVEHDTQSNMGTATVYTYDGAETTAMVVKTGVATGAIGAYKRSVDLRGIKRYFRFSVHQDLSASGTDTSQLMAGVVFFSGDAPIADSQ
jgi:hypothetical protein